MLKKVKTLYFKYKELINYAFFGGATTVVNMAIYYLLMLIPFFSESVLSFRLMGREYGFVT